MLDNPASTMDQVVLPAPDGARNEVRQNRENYIRAGDRARAGPDPYFVGREREIAMFLQALELTAEEGGSAGKDEALLVQGPPGAGKTALLEECAALASQRPQSHSVARAAGRTVLCAWIDQGHRLGAWRARCQPPEPRPG